MKFWASATVLSMTDYSDLFAALAGAGAAFVALTGGLVLQRLFTLQAEIAGHRRQLGRATADVSAAQNELAGAKNLALERYAQLVASDDEFLNELYGNVSQTLKSNADPSAVSLAVRQSRLAHLLLPQGAKQSEKQLAMLQGLWAYSLTCFEEAKPWIHEVVTSDDSVFKTIGRHPRPTYEDAWFDADLVWRALTYRLGQDEHADVRGGDPEDYVAWRSGDWRSSEDVGQSLSSLRDGLNRRHRELARADVRTAQSRLEERKTVRAQISVPEFDHSLKVEGVVTALLIVTMLVIPVLYLTPGAGSPPDRASAQWVSAVFLFGTASYLVYCLYRGGTLLRATKEPDGQSTLAE